MLHFARSTEYFPLTMTLSLREKEQQASDWCLAEGCSTISGPAVIEKQWTTLPLPGGEGRGEGEPSVSYPTVHSVSLAVGKTLKRGRQPARSVPTAVTI